MGYLKPLAFPGLPGPAPVMETPLRLSRTPATVRERAPLLGEHTDIILRELGYTADEISAFRSDGII
jgi:crotonobetainyl-CoA:carnitine CoA-transferase CaiB-like acyl-CoA transferase